MDDDGDEAAQQRRGVIDALWAYGAGQSDLGRAFARRMKMHPTDAAAIVEILRAEERGDPLTPGRLAERIGMASGAMSIVLNRLEGAGHLSRRRGHADRRRVTLHSTESIHGAGEEFFAPLAARLDAVMSAYSPEQLALIQELANEIRQTVDEHSRHR